MNDTEGTQAQVSDTLKDMVEGLLPLATVLIGGLIAAAIVGEEPDG